MRELIAILVAALSLAQTSAQVPPEAALPAVVEAQTGAYSAQRAVVALTAGRTAGVQLGDQFWVFGRAGDRGDALENDAGMKSDVGIVARGIIYFVTDADCVGRLDEPIGELPAGRPAVILHGRALPLLCDRLPPGVTVRGEVSRVPPDRHSAWLNLGRRAGLKLNDDVLIRRKTGGGQIPIARGEVKIVDDAVALVTVSPLVGNALPQAGDSAELWPEPAQRRWGKVNSAVLAVKADDEEPIVTLVGTPADGFEQGRLVDLYRGGRYVGVAPVIEASDPLSDARLIASASPLAPEVGDDAVLRAGPARPEAPLQAAVFRVEGEYCLLAAGESDGVRVGEKFVVRRRDAADPARQREIAELTVTTVKVEHAGADVRLLTAEAAPVTRWDLAERRIGTSPQWRRIGVIQDAHPGSRSVMTDVEPRCALLRGDLVRCVPESDRPPGAGIIISVAGSQAVAYVPPGWGSPADLQRARVEVPVDANGTSTPATRPASSAPARQR